MLERKKRKENQYFNRKNRKKSKKIKKIYNYFYNKIMKIVYLIIAIGVIFGTFLFKMIEVLAFNNNYFLIVFCCTVATVATGLFIYNLKLYLEIRKTYRSHLHQTHYDRVRFHFNFFFFFIQLLFLFWPIFSIHSFSYTKYSY